MTCERSLARDPIPPLLHRWKEQRQGAIEFHATRQSPSAPQVACMTPAFASLRAPRNRASDDRLGRIAGVRLQPPRVPAPAGRQASRAASDAWGWASAPSRPCGRRPLLRRVRLRAECPPIASDGERLGTESTLDAHWTGTASSGFGVVEDLDAEPFDVALERGQPGVELLAGQGACSPGFSTPVSSLRPRMPSFWKTWRK
jgi:hypothetical protein